MQQYSTIKQFSALVSQANNLGISEIKLDRAKAVNLLSEINILLADVLEVSGQQKTTQIAALNGGSFTKIK
jgi:hypothetical protein